MNKTSKLVGTGITLMVGSVLAVAPVAADAARQHPARICVDNASAGQCETVVRQSELPGGSGREVAVRPTPAGRIDAKDHPDYGQITVESPGRLDAKDHPDYGQITVESPGRLDAKDHPDYGQSTPENPGRSDAKDHPNYGPTSSPGGGGGVIPHPLRALRAL